MNQMSDPQTPLPTGAESWLDEHPGESREELERAWRLSELADDPFEPDPEHVAQMRDAITIAMTGKASRARILTFRPQSAWPVAASIALIALGATLWLRPISHTAPAGSTICR